MTSSPLLTTRELNRATLRRQLLLSRSDRDAGEVVEHLVGLQTQVPHNHYTALWSRLADFDPQDFSRRYTDREFVRLSMMRCTVHTVTARDALTLRHLFQLLHERVFRTAFGKDLTGVDVEAVAGFSRELLEDRPLSAQELGPELSRRWPEGDRRAMAQVARHLLALVQLPPRGLWQQGGQARHTTAEHWLGAEPGTALKPGAAAWPGAGACGGDADARDELVLRYLAAFGPASVKDIQSWCGLTRLREVVERHRDALLTFRDAQGTELFDLPDAPRPDGEVPAPPRFLPEFDNVFIGHADRSRIIPEQDRDAFRRIWNGTPAHPVFLSDGFVAGTWRLDTDRRRSRALLTVTPFGDLPREERAALEREGVDLLAFWAPGADGELRWAPPGSPPAKAPVW